MSSAKPSQVAPKALTCIGPGAPTPPGSPPGPDPAPPTPSPQPGPVPPDPNPRPI